MRVTYSKITELFKIDWGDNRPMNFVKRQDALRIDDASEAMFRAAIEMDERGCDYVDVCPMEACQALATLWKPTEP